jgi:hypothetical protein
VLLNAELGMLKGEGRSRNIFTPHFWALPLFLAAFFTKQTAIAAAVAGTAWLLVIRPRVGLAFGAAYVAGALVPSVLLNLWTDGGYYYHMFTIHDLPWFAGRTVEYVSQFFTTYWAILVPGVLAILAVGAVWLASRLGKQSPDSPWALSGQAGLLLLFYLGMAAVSAIGTGTHGGNHNHLLELGAACGIGLGVGVALVRRVRSWQVKAAFAAVGVLILLQLPGLFSTPEWLKLEFGLLAPDKLEGMTNIAQYVTNESGQAYSDNVGLLLVAGKRLWTTDPFTQTHATSFGRWDQSKLLEAFLRKEFSQVILRIDVFDEAAGSGDVSPEILQVVRDNYKLDQRNVENIYVPSSE